MSEHTPGPWWTAAKYSEEEGGCAIIAANTDCGPLPGNPTRGMVAWVHGPLPEDGPECEANSRLIAAAPDLLDALMDAVVLSGYRIGGWDELDTERPAWVETARAAIAKARGDQ